MRLESVLVLVPVERFVVVSIRDFFDFYDIFFFGYTNNYNHCFLCLLFSNYAMIFNAVIHHQDGFNVNIASSESESPSVSVAVNVNVSEPFQPIR